MSIINQLMTLTGTKIQLFSFHTKRNEKNQQPYRFWTLDWRGTLAERRNIFKSRRHRLKTGYHVANYLSDKTNRKQCIHVPNRTEPPAAAPSKHFPFISLKTHGAGWWRWSARQRERRGKEVHELKSNYIRLLLITGTSTNNKNVMNIKY